MVVASARGPLLMATTSVDGLQIAYDVVGEGPPWVITPGGRFSKDTPGVRELRASWRAMDSR
jgi:hypothetical protein